MALRQRHTENTNSTEGLSEKAKTEATIAAAALENVLTLAPLVERPELFEPEYNLTRDDLIKYSELTARYDNLVKNYPDKPTDWIKDQFNPFRTNKLSSILSSSRQLAMVTLRDQTEKLLGPAPLGAIEKRLDSCESETRENNFETRQRLAKDVFAIGKGISEITRSVLESENSE